MAEEMEKKTPGLSDISKNMQKKIQAPKPQAKMQAQAPAKKDEPWYKSDTGQRALLAAVPTLLGAAFGGAKGGQIGAQAGLTGLSKMDELEEQEKLEAEKKAAAEKEQKRYDEGFQLKKTTAEANRRIKQQELNLKKMEAQMKAEKQLKKEQGQTGIDNRLAKLGAEEKKRYDNVVMGNSAINKMAEALAGGDDTFELWGSNRFTIAKEQWNEALGRMQSGGAINAEEAKRFASMVPDAMDSREMQVEKLRQMKELMGSRLQTMGFQPEEIKGYVDPKFQQNLASYYSPAVGGMSQAVASGYAQALKPVESMSVEEMKKELGQ